MPGIWEKKKMPLCPKSAFIIFPLYPYLPGGSFGMPSQHAPVTFIEYLVFPSKLFQSDIFELYSDGACLNIYMQEFHLFKVCVLWGAPGGSATWGSSLTTGSQL